ncbi:hypothetical protein TH63_09650 [Rufibacter radiotolerans]|uniref:Uncharacterized protein n=1 Tax=Rufibacter radiotolerans TaxID=1379910 RepID=A0A0H4VKH3_9BACT|nr:hypothetical protein [Rufibacter radiotolerans]AKQ45848.1 hypothetical protein TH63_09650 [Rufibacter radiotolerans]
MKNPLLLLVASFCLMNCQSPQQQTEEKAAIHESAEQAATVESGKVTATNHQTTATEYIDWNSIKINNLLPLDANTKDLEKVLGKADSTVTPDYKNICNNCHFCTEQIPAFKYVYVKGVHFEQLKDSLIFWSADFTLDKSLFLQSGKLRLDHRTTLQEVEKHFPEAVKGLTKEETTDWIRISPSKQLTDGSFLLEFGKDGLLRKFYYHFPC